jgi:hypothetical protein
MDNHDPKNTGGDKPRDDKSHDSHGEKARKASQSRKKLENFLSSLCESKGMGQSPKKTEGSSPSRRIACKCPCADAEWRAQLDIPDGILCVYAKRTGVGPDGPHRDITLAVTYINDEGREDFTDMTFCDGEIRWVMEALWHAPIWD